MHVFLVPLMKLVMTLLDVLYFIIIAELILNLLIYFGIVNTFHPTVGKIYSALHSLTDPIYRRIRSIIPPFGNLDFSPLIALIAIQFIQNMIVQLAVSLV